MSTLEPFRQFTASRLFTTEDNTRELTGVGIDLGQTTSSEDMIYGARISGTSWIYGTGQTAYYSFQREQVSADEYIRNKYNKNMNFKNITPVDLIEIKDKKSFLDVCEKMFGTGKEIKEAVLRQTERDLNIFHNDLEYYSRMMESLQEEARRWEPGFNPPLSDYMKLRNQSIGPKIAQLQRMISEASRYRNELIASLSGTKDGKLEKTLSYSYDNFVKHVNFEKMYTDEYSSNIYIKTKAIIRKLKLVRQHFGEFLYVINPNKIKAFNLDYIFDNGGTPYDHPHIKNGNICLGNIGQEVQRHLKTGNFYLAFDLVIRNCTSDLEGNPYINFTDWENNKKKRQNSKDIVLVTSSDLKNNSYAQFLRYPESSGMDFTSSYGTSSGYNLDVNAPMF